MSWLQIVKRGVMADTGLAKDALHIYVALLLLFGSALLFRWPLRSWRPWLVVAVVALIGEAWDLRDAIVTQAPVGIDANLHDLWNTLFWPSVILLLARYTELFRR